MKIVIFDDNEKDLNELARTILSWKEQRGHSDIILNKYHSAHSLTFSLSDYDSYDVFFLDIIHH